jgi:hypothetical protein
MKLAGAYAATVPAGPSRDHRGEVEVGSAARM